MSDKLNRRSFLKLSAAGAAATAASLTIPASAQDFTPRKDAGRVIRVSHSHAMSNPERVGSDPDPAIVGAMVDTALLAFTGEGDVATAWTHFIHPEDQVLIKVNCLGSPGIASHRTVVEGIIRGLQAMGLPNEQMLIYDQYRSRMLRANYRPGREVLGVPVEFSEDRDYSDDRIEHGSGRSKFANALIACTAVINVPVLKDHNVCGITMSTKNMTHGVIHNPSSMHRSNDNHTDEGCTVHADIWSVTHIKDKVRLIVADALRILYDGGPQDNDNKVLHNSVYLATDPVAIDTVGLDAIAAVRAEKGERTFEADGRPCLWLQAMEAAGLGVHNREGITLEEHELG